MVLSITVGCSDRKPGGDAGDPGAAHAGSGGDRANEDDGTNSSDGVGAAGGTNGAGDGGAGGASSGGASAGGASAGGADVGDAGVGGAGVGGAGGVGPGAGGGGAGGGGAGGGGPTGVACTTTPWTVETVQDYPYDQLSSWSTIVADPTGTVHLFYTKSPSTTIYRSRGPGAVSWSTDSWLGRPHDAEIDALGSAHLVSDKDNAIRHYLFPAEPALQGTYLYGRRAALTTDPSGKLLMAHAYGGRVRFGELDPAAATPAWARVIVHDDTVPREAAVAATASDRYVAFTGGDEVMLTTENPDGTWPAAVTVDEGIGHTLSWIRAAGDAFGGIHLLYGNGVTFMRYAHKSAAGVWSTKDFTAHRSDLEIDPGGGVHIVFNSVFINFQEAVRHAYKNPVTGEWTLEEIALIPSAETFHSPSLFVDKYARLHVAYLWRTSFDEAVYYAYSDCE